MTLELALWVLGGYLAGTLPSTFLVAKAVGAADVIEESFRKASEGDAHVVMSKRLGGGWAALAAILDVGKGLVWVLAAREFGRLPVTWLAMVGLAVVVGHSFPFFARAMAGRGLAATAGVLLVLLPVEMVIAGIVMLIGIVGGNSGLASTLGFGSTSIVAALHGQPGAYVAMAVAITLVIMIRRLEGLGVVVRRTGMPWPRAVLYRTVFDLSGPPPAPTPAGPQPDEPRV